MLKEAKQNFFLNVPFVKLSVLMLNVKQSFYTSIRSYFISSSQIQQYIYLQWPFILLKVWFG